MMIHFQLTSFASMKKFFRHCRLYFGDLDSKCDVARQTDWPVFNSNRMKATPEKRNTDTSMLSLFNFDNVSLQLFVKLA